MLCDFLFFFFFKQKTAYERRISDWSSDVCSSDLSILVCCAGTGNAMKTASRSKEDGSIKHFPAEAFNRLIQINLVGTFRCVAKSAAGMLTLDPGPDGERGAIVMTASVAAADGQIGQAAYSASMEIGRAHVCTPDTNGHIVCRLQLEK